MDDEEYIRQAVRLDLESEGYQVWEAGCGNEAINMLHSATFDAVISDIRMPNGTGIELAKSMLDLPFPKPALLFLTAFVDIASDEIYDLGVEAIIAKPFNLEEIIEPLKKAVTPLQYKWPAHTNADKSTPSGLKLTYNDVKIGRGGMFVKLAREFPQCGTSLAFRIEDISGHSKENHQKAITGDATIIWVREVAAPGLPSGIGIAFDHIDTQSQHQLITWIESARARAHIPRA